MSIASRKYSTALIDVAKEVNKIDDIYNDFKIIIDSFIENRDFWTLINAPSIQKKQKKELLQGIYGEGANEYLFNFLMILIDKNRFSELKNIFYSFKELYLAERNTIEATIVSAIEIGEEHKFNIQEQLKKRYEKDILLHTQIDPTILGGLIVYVGDQVIDGSIKRKLSNLKNNLKEIRLQELGVN